MQRLSSVVATALALAMLLATESSAVTIGFEAADPSEHASYTESGVTFTANPFIVQNGALPPAPNNGTQFLQIPYLSTLSFAPVDGSLLFSLQRVDLTEYSSFYASPYQVTFVGYHSDGSTVTTTLTTNGLTAPNGTPLFQTFSLPTDFTNLTSVTIPTDLYSIDNVVLNLYPAPESSTAVLLAAGLGVLSTARRRGRREWPAA